MAVSLDNYLSKVFKKALIHNFLGTLDLPY